MPVFCMNAGNNTFFFCNAILLTIDLQHFVVKNVSSERYINNSLYIVQPSNTTSNIHLIINEWATSFGH